jgi:hypothetical protein
MGQWSGTTATAAPGSCDEYVEEAVVPDAVELDARGRRLRAALAAMLVPTTRQRCGSSESGWTPRPSGRPRAARGRPAAWR